MNRFARLIKFAVAMLILFAIYLARDRWLYERLLNSLNITLDDFPTDYTTALKALPDDNALKQYDYSNYPNHTSDTTIPPTIHFIWFQNLYETKGDMSDIPSIGSQAPELCQRYNPHFTINVWNSSAARTFLEENYEWFIETYDSYVHPIQRVDAIKYFTLHHYDGFYMDLDISCRRSLTPLQYFPAWVPRASPLGVNNDALGFRKGHPAVEKMIKMLRVRNKNLLFPYLTIFWSTGPQFTGDILKSYLEEYHGAGHKPYAGASKCPSDPDEVYVLPQELYSEEYTFFGHSPGGTWHEGDVAVVLWLVAHPWLVMLFAVALMIGSAMFAYKGWKRRRSPGYMRVQTVKSDDADTQASEKRVLDRSGMLLHTIRRQVQFLFGRKNEDRRLSMHALSSMSHTNESEDGRVIRPPLRSNRQHTDP